MVKMIAVAVQMVLLAAALVAIYFFGAVTEGCAMLLASFFALGFAFGSGSGGPTSSRWWGTESALRVQTPA